MHHRYKLLSVFVNYFKSFFADDRMRSFFSAYLRSKPSSLASKRIPFNGVISQQGTAYNSATGVYTAPHDGYYAFSVNILVSPGKRCNLGIRKNGVTKANIEANDSGGSSFQMGGHMVILQLNSGDRVWIQSYSSCNNIFTSSRSAIFSGFQIA